MWVSVPPEGPALGSQVQGLCASLVDGFSIVGGLVIAVAATGLVVFA
jgi:hypothetical protein